MCEGGKATVESEGKGVRKRENCGEKGVGSGRGKGEGQGRVTGKWEKGGETLGKKGKMERKKGGIKGRKMTWEI